MMSSRETSGQGQGKDRQISETTNVHILTLNASNEAERLGSIKRDTHVLTRVNDIWKISKIVEAQVSTRKTGSEIKFRYYVTYLEENRRMDEWVSQSAISLDQNAIQQAIDSLEQRSSMQQNDSLGLKKQKQYIPLFENDENKGLDKKQIQEHEEATKIKTIQNVQIGPNKIKTWYYSPFPSAFHCDTLYVCDLCLSFYTERQQVREHEKRCPWLHPPGDEIYKDKDISVFELDGKIQRTYCENLCLISKLFLDHKTLRFDCNPFHFYVLTEKYSDEVEQRSTKSSIQRFAGYFSKEKGIAVENNLSCILVMPYCQRKGYGKFLIEFSYALSQREGRYGTPERPLSDLGFRSYISYWAYKILTLLLDKQNQQSFSIQNISDATSIEQSDVMYVLENFKILRKQRDQKQILFTQKEYLEEILKNIGRPGRAVIKNKLNWIPNMQKLEK